MFFLNPGPGSEYKYRGSDSGGLELEGPIQLQTFVVVTGTEVDADFVVEVGEADLRFLVECPGALEDVALAVSNPTAKVRVIPESENGVSLNILVGIAQFPGAGAAGLAELQTDGPGRVVVRSVQILRVVGEQCQWLLAKAR